MITQRNTSSSLLISGQVYELTSKGNNIKRLLGIVRIVLVVGFVIFYSLVGHNLLSNHISNSIFVQVLIVFVAYFIVGIITYLIGHLILIHVKDVRELISYENEKITPA